MNNQNHWIDRKDHQDGTKNFKVKSKEWAISAILYVSVLSGPILACTCAPFVCLIPVSNVMEEPEFWYEDQITQFFAVIPLLVVCEVWAIAIYWTKFTVEKKWFSFILIFVSGCGIYGISVVAYYLLWTYALEQNLPCPFILYYGGTVACVVGSIAVGFRYSIKYKFNDNPFNWWISL